jgi:DNA-binding XRE family transcriptional regulator
MVIVMHERAHNVLLFDRLPTRNELRAAIAKVIRRIQAEHGETDEMTAQSVGVSVGTIANARNEKTDLNAVTIASIGKRYGPDALDPYTKLFGARAIPLEADEITNVVPMLASVLHKLTSATSPFGKLNHKEIAAILPDVRAAMRGLVAISTRADEIGIAA